MIKSVTLPGRLSGFGSTSGGMSGVKKQIDALLGALYPTGASLERRAEKRMPYPHLVYLTPVAPDGHTPAGETQVVAGKHLSENGLGFYHQQPLHYRRMIVSLDQGNGRWLGVLIDLTWCRFTKQGWYESGGRFLQLVPSPIDETPLSSASPQIDTSLAVEEFMSI
ncbi:MAG: hypothetical protein SFX18_16775 [Pirellulales bacterium]|nr:hypothetical protein [Pirellulales bacterium]